MQILKRAPYIPIVLVLTLFFAGCEQRTEQFEKIKELPEDQWVAFAERLPVNDRLDLYIEVKENTGHPGNQELMFAFSQDPQKAYNEIISRLKKEDDNSNYLWVLKTIDRLDNFSICDQSDRKYVQDFIKSKFKGLESINRDFVKDTPFYEC